MHIPLDDETEDRLSEVTAEALGKDFEKAVTSKVDGLVGEVKDLLHGYIAEDLQDDLKENIQDEARRTAERFMERLRAGDEKAVGSFLKLPNYVFDERNREHELLSEGSQYGGIALRKKLLEAVLPRLEAERIKDLEAIAEARLKALNDANLAAGTHKAMAETIAYDRDHLMYRCERLEARLAELEAKPSLSVVGE